MKIKETVSMYMMYAFAAVTDDPKFREENNIRLCTGAYTCTHTMCCYPGGGGGGGVLKCCLDGGARLKPPNPYPSLRVILAEKGTHY